MKAKRVKKPNVLLISVDSLRADHLSLYGYEKETTPHLTELSFDGTVFEKAFSAANWTGASIASILTGLYPTVHGFTNRRYYLDDGQDSLASILRQHGYCTICFSNNMYLSEKSGLHAGFDDFRYRGVSAADAASNLASQKSLLRHLKDIPGHRAKAFLKNVADSLDQGKALTRDKGACETELAFRKWLNDYSQEKPFFTYIHYQEPHSIYFPPYPYRRRFFSGSWLEESAYLQFDHLHYYAGKMHFSETQVWHYMELYDGEITYLDWRLGRLMKILKEKEYFENTIIIITADHGEMFGEHGFFWHAFCLYEPLIRVPLLLHYPTWFERDHRSMDIVQTTDIVPTLLEGLGIEWHYINNGQGQSFLNGSKRQAALTETFNPELMVDRWLQRYEDIEKDDFAHYLRDIRSYRTASEKLISASDGAREFYDLAKDPAESLNLYGSHDPRIVKCDSELKKWIASFTPHSVSNATQPGFDKATWEKMKALGYA
ncbi:sulfatase [candidate division KSB1 bacterium]|nr:sulfatase [candidate division KSB1 bacterium]